MRLLLIDFETTGLSPETERITEVGFVLRDPKIKKPLMEFASLIWDESYPPISQLITKITGIDEPMLKEFGKKPSDVLSYVVEVATKYKANYFVAHNGRSFDKPFLLADLKRVGIDHTKIAHIPWLDTLYDIPFKEDPDSKKLPHLAAAHGFLNPFPHSALSDVQTMDRLLSHYNIEDVAAYANTPDLQIKALVTREKKDLAKFNGFKWDNTTVSWIRTIKADQFENEKKRCIDLGFAIAKF